MIAEGLLLDSRCGFKRDHVCFDMIFVARKSLVRLGNMETPYIHDVYRLEESLRFCAQKCSSVVSSRRVWSTSNNVELLFMKERRL